MMILSIDLGKFQSVCCFYEKESGKHRFETIKTNRAHVKNLLDKNPCEIVIMEACGPSGWISDVCRSRDIKTLICSTNEEAWSWKSVKRKTDRDDARRLAQMYVHHTLVPVYMPQPAVREQRMIIKYRKTLDQRINRVKNTIRSLFANHGIEIDKEPILIYPTLHYQNGGILANADASSNGNASATDSNNGSAIPSRIRRCSTERFLTLRVLSPSV